MKRIISALLIVVMLSSLICVGTSAAGIVFTADFKTMTEVQFYEQFMPGKFFVDDASSRLCGYYDAKALQSMYDDGDGGIFSNTLNTWLTYDASVNLAMLDDDASEDARFVNLAYCNDNLRVKGLEEKRSFITFSYDIEKKQFDLSIGESPVYNAEGLLADPVSMDLNTDGEEFYTFGMSVDKNRIRFFLDNQVIYDYDATAYCVAESINSPFFLWNAGNFLQISKIDISTVGHMYPYASEPITTDVPVNNDDTKVTDAPVPVETTTAIEIVEVTNADGQAVTDASGEKVTEINIITQAPAEVQPADTNTNKPAGGSSTATGDVTFAVVVAMVATLGCALIVRKVNAD